MVHMVPKHPGFLIWSPSGSHMPRVRHDTFDSAQTEAKRLAEQNPGRSFYVMVPVGMAVVERFPAAFHKMDPMPSAAVVIDDDDDIPF